MKPEIVGTKPDSRLEYLLDSVKQGVRIFSEAIRNSPDTADIISFKAFTLKSKSKEETHAIFDLVMTSVAMELHEQSKDLISSFTFYHKIEEEDEHMTLWWYCRKAPPPTKEEVEKMVADDMTVASEALPSAVDEETAAVETTA
jgi:hypothetical protein